jgi:hypothetical protein
VGLGHVPKVFRDPVRGFHDETNTTLSVDIVRVELNFNGLSKNVVHVFGFMASMEALWN